MSTNTRFDVIGAGHTITAAPRSRALWVLLILAVAIGVLARLSPVIDLSERIFWQYLTEDGYLMQTIARNMALGLGMTTAEGTIPTNGVQPLATYLFAGLHLIAGGERSTSILLVTLVSTLISLGAAYCLYRLATVFLSELTAGRELALVVAVLWFCAPHIVPHSLNGLETSLYWLAVLGTLWAYATMTGSSAGKLSWAQRVMLGVLLGVTFLARNDAVFFIAALLAAHVFLGGGSHGGGWRHRFIDSLVAGLISIVSASPWLIYNLLNFGSVIPISGTAQSAGTPFAANLALVPAVLFEHLVLYLPIPGFLERAWYVMAVALVVLLACTTVCWLAVGRLSLLNRRLCLTVLIFGAGLTLYYGLFFGAPHFLPRYLSVLSPFLWVSTVVTGWVVLLWLFMASELGRRRFATGLIALAVLGAGLFAGKDFVQGKDHMHRQVVDWVANNVPESTWVGAVQTGTLGYFHERTLNLDGKVNPEALQRRLREGTVLGYVLETDIQYIVDWEGVADWVNHQPPEFGRAFTVLVHDTEKNLAVLAREGAPVNGTD